MATVLAGADSAHLSWVSGKTICNALGIHHGRLLEMERQGLIRARRLPGGAQPRWAWEDAVSLLAAHTTGTGGGAA